MWNVTPGGVGTFGEVVDRGKQVNKALHTCTSWYAYAAMFGSSMAFQCGSQDQLGELCTSCQTSLASLPLGRVLSAKTSSLNATAGSQCSVVRVKLAMCWHSDGQLAAQPELQGGGRCVCQVFVLVTAMRSLLLTTLPTVCVAGVS